MFNIDVKLVVVLARGDHEINDIKLKNALGATSLNLQKMQQLKNY